MPNIEFLKKLEFDLAEVRLHSSVSDIKKFMTSPIWNDIKQLLNELLYANRDFLETNGEGVSDPHRIYVQAECGVIRAFLDFPEVLLTRLSNEKVMKSNLFTKEPSSTNTNDEQEEEEL